MRRRSTSLVPTVLLILAAAPRVRAQDRSSAQSIPAGYGTLNQDDIAVRIPICRRAGGWAAARPPRIAALNRLP